MYIPVAQIPRRLLATNILIKDQWLTQSLIYVSYRSLFLWHYKISAQQVFATGDYIPDLYTHTHISNRLQSHNVTDQLHCLHNEKHSTSQKYITYIPYTIYTTLNTSLLPPSPTPNTKQQQKQDTEKNQVEWTCTEWNILT